MITQTSRLQLVLPDTGSVFPCTVVCDLPDFVTVVHSMAGVGTSSMMTFNRDGTPVRKKFKWLLEESS